MRGFGDFKSIGIALVLVAGLAGCGEKPGPAESAGKKIDQATEETIRKMNEATDKAVRELNETAAKLNKEAGEASVKLGEQSKKVGEILDDATITSKVKAAIFAEPSLKSLQINVDTVRGVVTLSGSVDSQESSGLAVQLASAVAGVKRVNNHLKLKAVRSD
ncbi:MAG TPA: BON domain-containing protein [Gallionella sp.]|nr:BON domain-containing protein [Gallionella sp.]